MVSANQERRDVLSMFLRLEKWCKTSWCHTGLGKWRIWLLPWAGGNRHSAEGKRAVTCMGKDQLKGILLMKEIINRVP